MRYELILARIAISKKMKRKCWQGCGGKGAFMHTVGGNVSPAVILNMAFPKQVWSICVIWCGNIMFRGDWVSIISMLKSIFPSVFTTALFMFVKSMVLWLEIFCRGRGPTMVTTCYPGNQGILLRFLVLWIKELISRFWRKVKDTFISI